MDPYGIFKKVISKIAAKFCCFDQEEQLHTIKKNFKIEKIEAEKTKRI